MNPEARSIVRIGMLRRANSSRGVRIQGMPRDALTRASPLPLALLLTQLFSWLPPFRVLLV
jgi:hypothetical protein